LAGFTVTLVSLFMLSGVAQAHKASHSHAKRAEAGPETCVIFAEPTTFMDQGEFAKHSSIADIVSVECEPVYAGQFVKISAPELFDRCQGKLTWAEGIPFEPVNGPGTTIKLDDAGNGGAVVWGGPSCAAGESLVSAHLLTPPYKTVTTAFTVLPPKGTEPGVKAEPAASTEGAETSSVSTIIEVEFPSVYAEEFVAINASQVFSRCLQGPKLEWVGPDAEVAGLGEEVSVQLDNDGNAFVVLLGGESCASGPSLIEASLEKAPYTTYTTTFTIEEPHPTFP
jgi:hypothetical protein